MDLEADFPVGKNTELLCPVYVSKVKTIFIKGVFRTSLIYVFYDECFYWLQKALKF